MIKFTRTKCVWVLLYFAILLRDENMPVAQDAACFC